MALRLLLAGLACASAVTAAGSSSSGSDSSASGSGSEDAALLAAFPLVELETRSGVLPWVDPDTPDDSQTYTSSRGDTWELVMSDEFNREGRNFTPGGDHLWTSLEMADGTNSALQMYGHNMTSVVCDDSDDVCYMQIEIASVKHTVTVYNLYLRPPAYQNSTFYYRSGSIQSWNKFCFQGGMIEVRVQLPGAITEASKNPDLKKASSTRVTDSSYYPTWPGVWFMGNLGRALFSASTSRMWPFSYDECNERVFNSSNQRISACNATPGHGLNPYQGRGAPEIDLLEGGGTAISSSIQIGPGMPEEYRRIDANTTAGDYLGCYYGQNCGTAGANIIGVPTALYDKRKYQSWYAGLRYAANNFCALDGNDTQVYSEIKENMENITVNTCNVTICPGAYDVYSDLDYIDGDRSRGRWGINSNGTCFPSQNAYQGAFLCDPDNQDERCSAPRNDTTAKTNTMEPFAYQMDAISSNWGIHVGAYTSFVRYQLEWVTGEEGYIRWMIEGEPVFEIPASSILDIGQDSTKSNPNKIFPEEPMYIIFNVALSSSWGASPPNAGKQCRGDGKDAKTNRICDSFPMYMKVDYIRLYQDRSNSSKMAVGCDPSTHPTKKWIEDHIDEYTDGVNTWIEVQGGAPCRDYTDCNFPYSVNYAFRTGQCTNFKCECINEYWGGPRCTKQLKVTAANGKLLEENYGPPLYAVYIVSGIALVITLGILIFLTTRRRAKRVRQEQIHQKALARQSMMNDLYLVKSAAVASSTATQTPIHEHDDVSEQSKSVTYSAYDG